MKAFLVVFCHIFQASRCNLSPKLSIAAQNLLVGVDMVSSNVISEGDIVGCVASVTDQPNASNRDMPTGEVESKLILTAAGFLGRQMES